MSRASSARERAGRVVEAVAAWDARQPRLPRPRFFYFDLAVVDQHGQSGPVDSALLAAEFGGGVRAVRNTLFVLDWLKPISLSRAWCVYEIAISLERPVTPRRSHRRHRRLLAMTAVEGDQRRDIDVAHPVAVREAEGLFIADVIGHPLEPSAGHGRFAGVDERHLPGLRLPLVDGHRVEGDVEGDVRHVEEVVGEILLDQIALVAAADHELVHAMGGIELHDMPEDRPAADLDHRLRLEVRFLRDPRSQAASENDCFHRGTGPGGEGNSGRCQRQDPSSSPTPFGQERDLRWQGP